MARCERGRRRLGGDAGTVAGGRGQRERQDERRHRGRTRDHRCRSRVSSRASWVQTMVEHGCGGFIPARRCGPRRPCAAPGTPLRTTSAVGRARNSGAGRIIRPPRLLPLSRSEEEGGHMRPRLVVVTFIVCLGALRCPRPPPPGATAIATATASARTTGCCRRPTGWPRGRGRAGSCSGRPCRARTTRHEVPRLLLSRVRHLGQPYGDAPKKVVEYYRKALAARKAGDWTAASRFAGIMAH